jgi:hypothetical protein
MDPREGQVPLLNKVVSTRVNLDARGTRSLVLDKSPKIKVEVDPPTMGTMRKVNHPM